MESSIPTLETAKFPCTKCPFKAKGSHHLKQHVLQKHTPGYKEDIIRHRYWNFECSMCPWSSTDDDPVLRHQHTQGHKHDLMPCPYSNCITVGKTTFQTPKALSKHCADVHRDMAAMAATKEARSGEVWGLKDGGARARYANWRPIDLAPAAATPAEAAAPEIEPAAVTTEGEYYLSDVGLASARGDLLPLPPMYHPS